MVNKTNKKKGNNSSGRRKQQQEKYQFEYLLKNSCNLKTRKVKPKTISHFQRGRIKSKLPIKQIRGWETAKEFLAYIPELPFFENEQEAEKIMEWPKRGEENQAKGRIKELMKRYLKPENNHELCMEEAEAIHLTCDNIVVVSKLCPVNLFKFVTLIPGVEYKPNTFAAAIYRISNPDGTMLLFGTGMVVLTGITSKMAALYSLHMIRIVIGMMGKMVGAPEIQKTNRVMNYNIGSKISLKKILANCSTNSCWTSNSFPGLVYRVDRDKLQIDPKRHLTSLLFEEGKIVFIGTISKKEEKKVIKEIKPIIEFSKITE